MHTHLKVWEAPNWSPSIPSPGAKFFSATKQKEAKIHSTHSTPTLPQSPRYRTSSLNPPQDCKWYWGSEWSSSQRSTKERDQGTLEPRAPIRRAQCHCTATQAMGLGGRFTPLRQCPWQSAKRRWEVNYFCGVSEFWDLKKKKSISGLVKIVLPGSKERVSPGPFWT